MKILYIDCFYGFSGQMLLGALADMCNIPPSDAYTVHKDKLVRNSIDCISARAEDTAKADVTREAIVQTLISLGIDYAMCSPIPVGDNADGEVISALQSGSVDMYPAERSAYILPHEAKLLASVIAECGDKPPMDIVSVGYGADLRDESAFLCATIGEYNGDTLAEKQQEYGEYV